MTPRRSKFVPALWLHRSNRIENLVDALAAVVRLPLADPLARECIVVHGRGIERWLSMQLAQRLGIWANPDFPFPRRLFERLLNQGEPAVAVDPYDPDVLTWCIASVLPELLPHPAFSSVRFYLEGNAAERPMPAAHDAGFSLIALAARLAELFDQYLVYRPDWIEQWDNGADEHWQALLWRAVAKQQGRTHIAARARAWLAACRRGDVADVPQRVAVFGLSTLAPLYLDLLVGLAEHAEVHLYLLSPSHEYWAWIRSQRETLRQIGKGAKLPDDLSATLQASEGNPLLASMGRVGREFQEMIEVAADYQDDDRYVDPGSGSMLAALQSDILNLRRRGVGDADRSPLPPRADDESIRIHACHSAMREVEVLHDQLLDLFERDRSLEPRDVIVLAPAIDTYAPLIDAVFGAAERPCRIPYRIADRKVRATDDVIDGFLILLTTLTGRFTAPEIMDLLTRAAVHTQFGMVSDDLEVVREWVAAAGIRWGIDAPHRAAVGQPPLSENTWRFGLDRLLLGYAMPGEERSLFGGVLPYDDIEGSAAALLGKLVEFCERLFELHGRLSAARTLREWQAELAAVLRTMLANTDANAHQHREILAALDELANQAELGGFTGRVELGCVRMQLESRLERSAPGRAFLSGGVTFGAMLPMRSVPFRVVCLLGMSDDDFPRLQRPLSFDRMAQSPRPGDRSRRDDDRYLFLEALLSARDRLIITFIGQSVRDNAELAPSVVVSELLDTLEASFASHRALREEIVIRHPLQPFSARYFTGDAELFSYAQQHFAGALRRQQERRACPPFVDAALPPEAVATVQASGAAGSSSFRILTVDDLASFFERPARSFLLRRLSLSLGHDVDPIEDREPLELDPLAAWKVGSSMVRRVIEGEDPAATLPALRASGALPPGTLGTQVWDGMRPTALTLAQIVARYTDGAALAPLEIDACVAETRIAGIVSQLWPKAQVHYGFTRLPGRREIGLWIRHLMLNWRGRADTPRTTVIIGRGEADKVKIVELKPVDDAPAILADLLKLYWLGQSTPLRFFADASRAYAERLRKTGKPAEALSAARAKVSGERAYEARDAYVQQAYGDADLLADDANPELGFAALSTRIYLPLLEHREEYEL